MTIRQGDLFEIGPHRFLCADLKNCAKWLQGKAGLFRDGERADLVWTDPPWNQTWAQQFWKMSELPGKQELDDVLQAGLDVILQVTDSGASVWFDFGYTYYPQFSAMVRAKKFVWQQEYTLTYGPDKTDYCMSHWRTPGGDKQGRSKRYMSLDGLHGFNGGKTIMPFEQIEGGIFFEPFTGLGGQVEILAKLKQMQIRSIELSGDRLDRAMAKVEKTLKLTRKKVNR